MIKSEQSYEIIVEKENPNKPNIEISVIEDRIIQIKLNGYKLFGTLANIEPILVALNDKIKELIQRHLQAQAQKENLLNKEK